MLYVRVEFSVVEITKSQLSGIQTGTCNRKQMKNLNEKSSHLI
jgi:hypothetical protein